MHTQGKPSVVLIKTVKGYRLGPSAEGRNTAHQKKDFSLKERVGATGGLVSLGTDGYGLSESTRRASESF